MNVPARDVAKLMGGKFALGRDVRDYADLDAVVEGGLPALAAKSVLAALSPGGELSTTLALALKANKPDPNQSRLIERAIRLLASAEAAFGSREDAVLFLFAPHDRLGGKRPIDCAETELSLKQVEQILESILFGLPA